MVRFIPQDLQNFAPSADLVEQLGQYIVLSNEKDLAKSAASL